MTRPFPDDKTISRLNIKAPVKATVFDTWLQRTATEQASFCRCSMLESLKTKRQRLLPCYESKPSFSLQRDSQNRRKVKRKLKKALPILAEVDNSPQNWHVFNCSPRMGPQLGSFKLGIKMSQSTSAWGCLIGGHMPGKPRRAPHFLPHIHHTRSPTAPIWNICNGIEFSLRKNIIATKWKITTEWLVFYDDEPFSHGNHHIRA